MMTPALLLKATAILILALAATWFTRGSRAALRHVLLAAGFAMLLLLPAASTISPVVAVTVPAALQNTIEPLDDPMFVDSTAPPEMPSPPLPAITPAGTRWNIPSVSALLPTIWIAGVAIFLLPVVVGLWKVRLMRRSSLPWRAGQQMVDRLRVHAGVGRPVQALLHETLPGPMTCGIISPAIVFPADASAWSHEDLDRAIVHELAHVRRLDWLTQCSARVIAAVYWLHPIVWLAWRQFGLEAERACDDAVLSYSSGTRDGRGDVDETAYADQLVHLAQRLSAGTGEIHLAMANRRDLSARVAAVLDSHRPRGRAGRVAVIAASLLAMVVVAAISPLQLVARPLASPGHIPLAEGPSGQSAPPQKYEVASIKRCNDPEDLRTGRARGSAGGTNASISPGRFSVPCVTLEQLVYLAYASYGAREDERLTNDYLGTASDPMKVRGGPDWAHSSSDKWAIEAIAPGVTERTMLMGTLLQRLLEDRFKLKIRRTTETVPMYALRVAKGGLKLKPLADDECDKRRDLPESPTNQRCGLMLHSSGPVSRLHYVGFKLSFLARLLSESVRLHVIDETGVPGDFVIDLQYAGDETSSRVVSAPPGADTSAEGPSIFTALEQQLGLKLDKITGPKGFIVIEHAERPTPDGPARATGAGQSR